MKLQRHGKVLGTCVENDMKSISPAHKVFISINFRHFR